MTDQGLLMDMVVNRGWSVSHEPTDEQLELKMLMMLELVYISVFRESAICSSSSITQLLSKDQNVPP